MEVNSVLFSVARITQTPVEISDSLHAIVIGSMQLDGWGRPYPYASYGPGLRGGGGMNPQPRLNPGEWTVLVLA